MRPPLHDPAALQARFDRLALEHLTVAEKALAKAKEVIDEDTALGHDPDMPIKERNNRLKLARDLAITAGVGTDKASLLTGRATDRTETHTDARFAEGQAIVARIKAMQASKMIDVIEVKEIR